MKKLLIIITLFVSSFFLISIKEANALELNRELDFSLLNDETLTLKEELEDYVSTHTSFPYYIIYKPYNSSSVSAMVLKSSFNPTDIYYNVTSTYPSKVILYFGDSVMTTYPLANLPNYANYFYLYFAPSSFAQIIYSNFDIPISEDLIINYTYNDFSYVDSVDTTNKITTLYDIYRNFNGEIIEEQNPHQEEIDKLGNFYTLCIGKLKYLSEVFLSNYIYLSIIVIFIIIFVFKLIFRRFL